MTFALVEARERALGEVVVVGLIGVAALVVLVLWTLGAPEPLVPPRLLRRPGLAAANAVTLVVYAALGVNFLFLPVFLQFLGLSPTVAGLFFIPPSIALILLAPRFGRVADRAGPRIPVAAGAAAIGVSVLLLLPVAAAEDVWVWGVASILVFSVGIAGIVAPITAAALSPAPEELAGIASGLSQTVARVGGVLSVAAVGAFAGWVYSRSGGLASAPFDPATPEAARDAGIDAFQALVLVSAGLAFAGAVLAVALLAARRPARDVGDEATVSPCPQAGPSA